MEPNLIYTRLSKTEMINLEEILVETLVACDKVGEWITQEFGVKLS